MIVRQVSASGPFGILDFEWGNHLPDFAQFNLVYGWNRSGKTTLSRLFEACEQKSVSFQQYPKGGTFSVLTDSGRRVTQDNLDSSGLSVRVFNQDFIDENVSFDASACRPIVYISEQDIADKRQLDEARAAVEPLALATDSARRQHSSSEKRMNQFYESTALAIKNSLGNLNVNDQYRAYDKRKLRTFLDSHDLDSLHPLSEEELQQHQAVLASDPKPVVKEFSPYSLRVLVDDQTVVNLVQLDSVLRKLLTREVVSETLDRLKHDAELNRWVKAGFDLQRDKGIFDSCPYCEQPLDSGFLDKLRRHFSEDYRAFEAAVSDGLAALDRTKLQAVKDAADLYPEFAEQYADAVSAIDEMAGELNDWLTACEDLLRFRLDSPLASSEMPPRPPSDFEERFNAFTEAANQAVGAHNAKREHHSTAVQASKDRIAEHLIFVAAEAQDFLGILRAVTADAAALHDATERANENALRITTLENKASSIGKALEKINAHLNDFFGRDEIQLALDADSKGYQIGRCGRAARNLSEGEKTAIAFSYFIAKVQERSFRLREGIVVIDDPISSLDSNFVFHSFALIQRHFAAPGQLFILTHNFELFNLTKGWFNRKNSKRRKQGQPDCCGFYTVENRIEDGVRLAHVSLMDETLRTYNSEYQYLFVRLKRFADADTVDYADLYTVGNVARRFLEIYAGFKVPTTADLRGKVEQLVTTTVTDVQKDKVYRLVQEFSHSDDPTSAVVHKDRCEAQAATAILMKIIQESDPPHYGFMCRNMPALATPVEGMA